MSEFEQEAQRLLSPERVCGIISSLKGKGTLDPNQLKTRIIESGGPKEQADFLSGILTQVNEDSEIESLRKEEKKHEVHSLELKLAGRLNSLVQYLVTLPPDERANLLSVGDRLGQMTNQESWNKIRRGLVGTTGAMILLSRFLNKPISLPSPKEDVDFGVDFATENTLIQLKTRKGVGEIEVYTHPAQLNLKIELQFSSTDKSSPQEILFHQRLKEEVDALKKLFHYAATTKKQAVFIVIPQGEIDYRTCESTGKSQLRPLKDLKRFEDPEMTEVEWVNIKEEKRRFVLKETPGFIAIWTDGKDKDGFPKQVSIWEETKDKLEEEIKKASPQTYVYFSKLVKQETEERQAWVVEYTIRTTASIFQKTFWNAEEAKKWVEEKVLIRPLVIWDDNKPENHVEFDPDLRETAYHRSEESIKPDELTKDLTVERPPYINPTVVHIYNPSIGMIKRLLAFRKIDL